MKNTGAGYTVLVLLAVNLILVLTPFLVPFDIGNNWYKGPLIDPVSPYSSTAGFKILGICLAAILDAGLFFAFLFYKAFSFRGAKLGRAKFILIMLLATICSISLVEVGLRTYLSRNIGTMFMPDPDLNWKLVPNLDNYYNELGGEHVSTNSHGWRAPELPNTKGADEYRVMAMGDSSNYGLGVQEEETWAIVLQKLLAQSMPEKKVTVFNVSCPGHTTHQALKLIERDVHAIKPDMVILGYNNDPALEYYTDKQREEASPVLKKVRRFLYKSRFFIIFRQVIISVWRGYKLNWESPDEVHRRAVDGNLMVNRVPLDDYKDNLKKLKQMALEENFSLVFLSMPVNFSATNLLPRFYDKRYPEALKALAQQGALLVDIDGKWKAEGIEDFLPGHIFHPDSQGHKRIAHTIFETLNQPKLLSPISIGYSKITPLHTMIGEIFKRTDILEKNGFKGTFLSFTRGHEQADARDILNVTFTCEVPAIEFFKNDDSWQVIGETGSLGSVGLLAIKDSNINKLSDIKGHKIGVPFGSTAHMDLLRWATQANLAPQKDFELINLGIRDHEAALKEKRVDAVATWDPWVSDLQVELAASLLAKRPFYSLIIMKKDYIAKNASFKQSYIHAIIQALQFAQENFSTVVKWTEETSGIDQKVLKEVLKKSGRLNVTGFDLEVSEEALMELHSCKMFTEGQVPTSKKPLDETDPSWSEYKEKYINQD